VTAREMFALRYLRGRVVTFSHGKRESVEWYHAVAADVDKWELHHLPVTAAEKARRSWPPMLSLAFTSQSTDEPDDVTGMWIVAPEEDGRDRQVRAVIGLDTILRPARLVEMYRDNVIPIHFRLSYTFHAYYMSKYMDHHALMVF